MVSTSILVLLTVAHGNKVDQRHRSLNPSFCSLHNGSKACSWSLPANVFFCWYILNIITLPLPHTFKNKDDALLFQSQKNTDRKTAMNMATGMGSINAVLVAVCQFPELLDWHVSIIDLKETFPALGNLCQSLCVDCKLHQQEGYFTSPLTG